VSSYLIAPAVLAQYGVLPNYARELSFASSIAGYLGGVA